MTDYIINDIKLGDIGINDKEWWIGNPTGIFVV